MDPSSSNHHNPKLKQAHPNPLQNYHHTLCNGHGISSNSNNSLSNLPLNTGIPAGLPVSIPHQLSQLCSNQQYPLLALQQNFSHLLPPNFPNPLTYPNRTHDQATQETQFRNQRIVSNNHYNHHHHIHHRHNNEHSHQNHQRGHHNWRKSKHQVDSKPAGAAFNGSPLSLLDLSAKIVAEHIPFQSIEQKYQHIPEPVQRRIIFWSFPRHEDDIKMYSSLSSDTFTTNAPTSSSTNTSNTTTQSPSSNSTFSWADQPTHGNTVPNQTTAVKHSTKQLTFHKGLRLYDEGCVQDALQVGFNLSGTVKVRVTQPTPASTNARSRGARNNTVSQLQNNDPPIQNHAASVPNDGNAPKGEVQISKSHRVSVTFDRCKITSVSCSCELQDIFWCEHAVALIIHRIRNPETIDLRVPISETLSNLDRQQLQKLVQYIIAEHHTEVLPTAQRLLDEMRQSFSEINQIHGAPDPTAGACSDDEHSWHLDENQVNEKVQNYLNSVSSQSEEASKQIHALFEKIREMFRAKDSNGTRLLTLITEQFLSIGTKSEKHRPLWDQLTFLWVVVTLNPDLTRVERSNLLQQLNDWSRHSKCPKEDQERRVCIKRKIVELSDDEDSEDNAQDPCTDEYSIQSGRSNIYPAHMATHRRNFQTNNGLPILRPFNQISAPQSGCSCQLPHSINKRMRADSQQTGSQMVSPSRNYRPSSSSVNSNHSRVGRSLHNSNEVRPATVQEPRSIFHRAIDFMDASWDDPHLQLILNKDGPLDFDSNKSHLVYFGYPLWYEPISQSAARIETLRSHGYREQALRLTVATIRRLKLQQEHRCIASSPDSEVSLPLMSPEFDSEGWIGHPFDPINVMLDLLLSASMSESSANLDIDTASNGLCSVNPSRCSCPYNQALMDFTQRIFPDLASFSYQHRNDAFPLIPLANVPARRASGAPSQTSPELKKYYHVPVPGCCQKDSYLTLGFELALMALSQQRPIPTVATAHDRAVRQEEKLISRLETIDISDPILIEILERQTTLLLEGGPFHNSCCSPSVDTNPLHTFAKYLFESLVPYYPALAYKVGVHALKMPLSFDENNENIGAARTSPRSTFNQTHLQFEQLSLAQAMLSRAKEEKQFDSFLRKVYRASVKNIRNSKNLHVLSKHALKEAKSISGCQMQQQVSKAVLQTAFDLGCQVLKMTLNPQSTNSKSRRDAILFIVECATDIGLEAVLQVMKDARDNFTAIEALSLVVSRDSELMPRDNLRTQAIAKLKLKEVPQDEARLNRRSRDLALDCAARDPTNCALEAIKFCEVDDESLKKALKIVIDAGSNGTMDSTQLIKVADHIHERGMTDRAFDISIVAVDGLTSSSNLDNPSAKKDIFSACEYASKVNGFSILIPKLLNIENAYVLSDIYHRFSPQPLVTPTYNYTNDVIASYRGGLNYNREYNDILSNFNPEIYKQKLEDAGWWEAMLKRTMNSFIDTTRSKLQNISPRHYGEFIDFLAKAQAIFDKAADGPKQFKDLIAEIVKSYRTKKKLMEKLKSRFETLNINAKL